jgi:hypothetical protein
VVVVSQAAKRDPEHCQHQQWKMHALSEVYQHASPEDPGRAADNQNRAGSYFAGEKNRVDHQQQRKEQRNSAHNLDRYPAISFQFRADSVLLSLRLSVAAIDEFPARSKYEIHQHSCGVAERAEKVEPPWRSRFVAEGAQQEPGADNRERQ